MKKLLVLLMIGMLVLSGCNSQEAAVEPEADEPAETQETAEGWVPEEDVEFIIPFSPGGGSDVFARKMVEIIAKNDMAPVNFVPTNKPGGSGVVAYSHMNGQGANNYIMATTSSSFYTQPLSGNSPLNCYDDFTFVAHMAKDPTLVAAYEGLGMTSLEEVIEYAKENPGELKYGGTGNASDDTILMYMLNELAGIELTYVPYDSGGEVLAAVLGGHIDICAASPSEGKEHLEAGTLVPLAVSADERLSILPDVPTFLESGYDINHQQSRGVVMNAGVSEEVLDYYADLFHRVSETDEWKAFLEDNVMGISYMGVEEYTEFNNELADKYTKFLETIQRAQ